MAVPDLGVDEYLNRSRVGDVVGCYRSIRGWLIGEGDEEDGLGRNSEVRSGNSRICRKKTKEKLTTMDKDTTTVTPAPFNPYRNLPADIQGEVFARLIDGEVDFMVPERYYDNEKSRNLRRYAVLYIEEVRRNSIELHLSSRDEKFDALIPYTAMTYFDRFCSAGDVPPVVKDTQIDLCLTCCLIIAWKLRTKTFDVEEFLKKIPFTAENVLHMELQICKRLKWRIQALTPFTFIDYFLQMLNLPSDLPSPLRAVRQLILTSQYAVAFTRYRPSIVAAAALLVVAKIMFPGHCNAFEMRIKTHAILNPHVDMMLECEERLKPLYRDPTTPAAGEGPSLSTAMEDRPLGEIQSTLAEFKSDPVNPDKLMNFELRWVEALKADADAACDDDADADADGISKLVQKLNAFCNGFGRRCHIL
ncbi:hypothetical protein CDL12_20240 [Handroanthus impetiginosus]|uniref:Cyclin C-terminal domain-containing protein n=1 Tax=Handroanthus impetiginosus TaxID=429701 RepID=A0A2G9GPP1_9LAMI|nr:hypothetical protein CDL12_20240 [Handroanthus impetiginosus]